MSGFEAALGRVPLLLAQHFLLSAAAIALGLAFSLPLILVSVRRPAIGRLALALAGLVQTIPALALLALFYPLLLLFSATVGGRLPALGFLPSLLALTLYAVLPILRNGVTGLAGLDPAVIEAAEGMGMTSWQKLRLVEAPLALPMLMAGIRTAAVWTVGAATLATTVGQASLGDLIFAGLQTQDWALVLAGCLAAAALAMTMDGLLGWVEHGLRHRKRRPALTAAVVIVAALLLSAVALWPRGERTIVIGAKNFSEQFILARLIGHRLERAGYRVEYREGLGSAVIFSALQSGDVDLYVDYAGTLWGSEMRRHDRLPRAAMIAAIGDWARRQNGVRLLAPLGFENAYAFAMQPARARSLGVASLADLTRVAPRLTLGSDLEFLDRPEWRDVRDSYGLRFATTQPYAPTFLYRALGSGRADVISAFSSDGRIAADRLTLLTDPRGAIPGYDALLLVDGAHAGDTRLTDALAPLARRISLSAMQEANYRVDRDAAKQSPDAAARWLARRIGLE
ncbi:ABC transporter permease/substrate-binding protein [Sphingomonas aracearum]|uniref:ABC transporter permease subunit n=1 Tax=Sphingomonas aracearum TaxID=2283317 RepID=A0A369VST1_9SPHN|nr:ABC transporter permease/substrate-binding protein [Sphingomonas aracearum]RDE04597.1 ABC transporter permease subunit [Sphingomonas aracearum]